MFLSSFQLLFEFSNENLVNNKNLTTTADDETTVVGGRDKSAVGSVSRARACADRFVPSSTTTAICSLGHRRQTPALLFQDVPKCLKTFASTVCGFPFVSMKGLISLDTF